MSHEDYILKLNELKTKNSNKLEVLNNKIKQCNELEDKLNNNIKLAFNINDKLIKIQNLSEDLFFEICKNIQLKV